MKERQATIRYPESLLLGLKSSAEQFEKEAAMLVGAKLYEMRRISSGQAAKIAGMDRLTFLFELERYGIPVVEMTREEFEEEIQSA